MTTGGSSNKPSGWRGLSETSKVAIIAAGITGTLGIIAAIVGPLIAHGSSSSNPPPRPPAAASSSPVSPSPSASLTSGGNGSPTVSPTGSAASGGGTYTAAYKSSQLTIQTMSNGSCGYGELVNIDKPNVDPQTTNGDSFYLTSSTCNNWSFQVQLYNNASGNKPEAGAQLPDNPSACASAIASDPNPGTDNARVGDSFCVASTDGFVAYVKIVSVDAQGDVILQLDAWSTGGPVANGGASAAAAYAAAYTSTQLTIQVMSNGSCGYGELVNIDKPNVDPQTTNGDSFYLTSSTCNNWSFQVQLYNNASGNQPAPSAQLTDSPSACLSAIASDPNPGTDNARVGDSYCVASTDGFLAYVKIVSVDAQGDVKLRLNAWSTRQ